MLTDESPILPRALLLLEVREGESDRNLPGKSNNSITTSCKSVIKETNKELTEKRTGGKVCLHERVREEFFEELRIGRAELPKTGGEGASHTSIRSIHRWLLAAIWAMQNKETELALR